MDSFKRLLALLPILAIGAASAWTPVAVIDDPLVRMPGTQPGQATLEAPNRCLNCHAGYNTEVEPGFNWMGSMMAHSARDFLFYACMTVAAQDSIWAVGTPNAVDLCERCHFPKGWLEGRSDPPNASAMTGADFDGVQCDFCHQMWDPKFKAAHQSLTDWDETNASSTPSGIAALETLDEDSLLATTIRLFNGGDFFDAEDNTPVDYTENASGQYFISPNSQKRASFADAAARHQMLYSRYHKSKYFCATCHDVSNPVLANLGADPTTQLPTESNAAHAYFHVERTFSEFMLSAYGQEGGAPTNADFQAQGAPGITHAAKCQDCHMRDVRGMGANKNGVPVRPDESVEHPDSGQPLHDMTGGNAWVSTVLASAVPGSPNYDATNADLLGQGPDVLTLDLSQGQGIDPVALLAGADRAKQQLLLAATITDLSYDSGSGALSFRVQNNTGHKLISGFPEGRRMFINVKAYAGGNLIYEVNPYDESAGTLKGLGYSYLGQGLSDPEELSAIETHVDELVYEMHPSSNLTGEDETFHFALADGRHKDNRIPPKGFKIAAASDRLSVPVWRGVEDSDLFTPEEYAGGYDEVSLTLPSGADSIEVNLYYQTTSREYVEFLRDEINGDGANNTLSSPTPSGEPVAYVAQDDPFFAKLKGWGDTIWQLWTHNKDVPGAAPFLMASASTSSGGGTPTCEVTPPTLTSATPGHTLVTLEWFGVSGATGYNLYYDQAGKAQLVTDAGDTLAHTDTELTDGQEYCYKVAAYDAVCESAYSNILCAIPQNQGQMPTASATDVVAGYLTGKGNNKTFVAATSIPAGETVVIRVLVSDGTNAITDATVNLGVTGPETTELVAGPSGSDGWAEATWQTQAPNKKGLGGTTLGNYTATVTNVSASGYVWDDQPTSVNFSLE